jgi:dTDP-4-dehydrorhamnose 3,5-epimerase
MVFEEAGLPGAYSIEPEKKEDERGFNARVWCQREFEEQGLTARLVQTNVIFAGRKGTLRGIHYQAPPHAESKLFRVTSGALYAVIIDLRTESRTYMQWASFELTAENRRMLYVPERFAIGSQTLQDNTELTYQVSEFYTPESGRGIRYDDPAFGIEWPLEVAAISEKDRTWPDYREESVASTPAKARP